MDRTQQVKAKKSGGAEVRPEERGTAPRGDKKDSVADPKEGHITLTAEFSRHRSGGKAQQGQNERTRRMAAKGGVKKGALSSGTDPKRSRTELVMRKKRRQTNRLGERGKGPKVTFIAGRV